MKARALQLALLLLCLLWPVSGWCEGPTHLFLPTRFHNPQRDRYDALRLEFRNLSPEDAGAAIARAAEGVLRKDLNNLRYTVYVSPDSSAEEQERYLRSVVDILRKQNISTPYLEVRGAKEEVLESVRLMSPGVDVVRSRAMDPEFAKSIIEKSAAAKAWMGAGSRAVQLGITGVDPSIGGAVGAAGLVSLDAVLNYYGTKHETEIERAFQTHKVPFFNSKWYETNKLAQFIKGFGANILVWSLGANGVSQLLSHQANPDLNRFPGGTDFGRWAVTGVFGSASYVYGFQGLEKLRQRGWISQSHMDLYLRGLGLVYQITTVANTSGNPELEKWLATLIVPYWGLNALPGIASNAMGIKNDRVVFVDPKWEDRATLDYLEGLESTRVLDGPEAIRDIAQEKELSPIRSCWDKWKRVREALPF